MRHSSEQQATIAKRRKAKLGWLVAPFAASALLTAPASGQEVDPQLAEKLEANARGEGDELCVVFSQADERAVLRSAGASRSASPAMMTIYAACRGQGILLGRGTAFDTATHAESGAVAVVVSQRGKPRVYLLSISEDGLVVREELTGALADDAGRGPMSSLADVNVDLSGFAEAGTIALAPNGREDARPARATQVSLAAKLSVQSERSLKAIDAPEGGE